MQKEDNAARHGEAVTEFNEHENRTDARHVISSLCAGLTVLRELFYRRLHDDVQRIMGTDSMLAPVSEPRSKALTMTEAELYQIAESRAAVRIADYVDDESWYEQWLLLLRLGQSSDHPKAKERLARYATMTDRDRRLALSNLLAKIFPQSRRVPLILFRLYPLSVQIVTTLAFDDQARATALRDQQVNQLPAIQDCGECHGSLLDNGQQCQLCANPIWKWEFLAAV